MDPIFSLAKFEIIYTHKVDLLSLLDSFIITPPHDAFLPGAPLSAGGSLDAVLETRCKEMFSQFLYSAPIPCYVSCIGNSMLRLGQIMRTELLNTLHLAIAQCYCAVASTPYEINKQLA